MDSFSIRETPQLLPSGEGSTRNSIPLSAGASHVTTQYTTTGSASKKSNARIAAELIQARGRISQLELQLELTKTHRATKRARVEEDEEEELERHSFTTSQELQRLHTVSRVRERGGREEGERTCEVLMIHLMRLSVCVLCVCVAR